MIWRVSSRLLRTGIQDLKTQTLLDQQDRQRQRLEERGQSLRRLPDQQRLRASTGSDATPP